MKYHLDRIGPCARECLFLGVSPKVWDCVYLTSSLRFADAVVRLLGRADLRARAVATLDHARSTLGLEPGAALITDLLDTQTALASAEASLAQARWSCLSARAAYERAVGRP